MKKNHALLILFLYALTTSLGAQINPIENYQNTVKSFATIYSGELEHIYSPIFYDNFPYYNNGEYKTGTLWTHTAMYKDVKMRLDLYREQLIALTPEHNQGVLINPMHVVKLTLGEETFIYFLPQNDYKLRGGYYKQLHKGDRLNFLMKQTFSLNTPQDRITRYFSQNTRYYLIKEDKTIPVKNRSSLNKLFPQYKKEMKKYRKENNLSGKENTENTLTQLIILCEKLMAETENL